MYGHVLPRLGKWNEALVQFEKADAIEQAYAREQKLRPGDDWHHVHNLQLLGYTYLRLGRLDDAEKSFRRAFDTPIRFKQYGWQHATLAEYYLLRGRPEEALATARKLRDRTPGARAAGAAVEGETLLALGRREEAAEAAKRARTEFEAAKADRGYDTRWIARFVEPFIRQLEAEIALTEKAVGGPPAEARRRTRREPALRRLGRGALPPGAHRGAGEAVGAHPLVRDIHERMRKIDPGYEPGSTARTVATTAAAGP